MQIYDFIVTYDKSKLSNQQRALTKEGRAGHSLKEHCTYLPYCENRAFS